jgi:tRNA U34 5-methylaminomethyl-2-thiouridine-forming methyltransferase MnmC
MTETSEFWKNHNYELVLTEDQSPTLRWLGSETQETMHHRGGAYSETQAIYGHPLRESLQAGQSSVLSVGLGLGYNEILTGLEALRFGLAPSQVRLLSYESDPFLKSHFLEWVQASHTDLVYDEIFKFFQTDVDPQRAGAQATIPKEDLKKWLLQAHEKNSWKLEGALEANFEIAESYACIFYDAFSSKTSPHLWQEGFLSEFFNKACGKPCWMSTYACTGALKRALKSQRFELVIRDGFQSKRNSTLGLRKI